VYQRLLLLTLLAILAVAVAVAVLGTAKVLVAEALVVVTGEQTGQAVPETQLAMGVILALLAMTGTE
jgi:hypothetical protein